MSLRSAPALATRDALVTAAKRGYGLRVEEVQALLPEGRLPAGIMWELRRHGAELIAVRKGRIVVGWVLKSDVPEEVLSEDKKVPRADRPTPQAYMDYRPGVFAKRPIVPFANKKKTEPRRVTHGPVFSQTRRPLTNAARKLGAAYM